ncbi:kinesin-3 isoform X2 [Micractinium conductrix]|uniref:Kinesin-3 isoform X2 n=1 Tax=Micractinium conductrix TaxID=554055 RepID=A0A2P6VBH4_9CHLO|nr:kinesin-3 isoform X2 [Micractinium conductrix]|eukprot:PSC71436.1 kinesin-3 isoform X2 [Micractinium conductrix]
MRTQAPAGSVSTTRAAPSASVAAPPPAADGSAGPPADGSGWEEVAAETGWTPADCLAHKLSFGKRADAKSKVDALVAHVKRLRSAGWHLHEARDAAAADAADAAERADAEAALRRSDRETSDLALREVQRELGSLAQAARAHETQQAQRQAEVERLQSELSDARSGLREAEEAARGAAAEGKLLREQVESLQGQARSLTDMQTQAQKYNAQLQQYNSKMQGELQAANEALARSQAEKAALTEECAALKGRLTALEEQLAGLAAVGSSAEALRASALEDASRLRGEVAGVAAQRDNAVAEAARLRGELEAARSEVDRFREATGKDVGALEAEKAARGALESRTQAQAELNSNLHEQVILLREQKELSESKLQKSAAEVKKLNAKVKRLEKELVEAERKVVEGEALRKKLHNTIQELKGNIRVFCRVRPPASGEAAEAAPGKPVVAFPAEGDMAGRGLELAQPGGRGGKDGEAHSFGFDKVFAPQASQGKVFEEISQLVQSALDGYKVCIFAYGQTGSGKTHTMMGSPEQPGMIPRAMDQIFATAKELEAQGWRYEMKAAMLEIYNEELRDLLGKGLLPAGKKHAIQHDDKGSTTVSYCEHVDVSTPEGVAALLERAMKARSVAATAMNEQSSRSHMVFMLAIEGANATTGQKARGLLNLIDLAGSERLSRSAVSGERLKETQAINKSLSALGDVIAALGNKEAHVPYRNSKLTFLLQSSLGGASSKTLMFVNVSPSAESAPESLCSLRFAAKVNACEIGTAKRQPTTARQ